MTIKPKLTTEYLIQEAKHFCLAQSKFPHTELFGVTDGKAVGTLIEQQFQQYLKAKYDVEIGSSARGIDLPSDEILTDIKVTSIKQPQSSSPFRDVKQKVYGLGYNLLVFVYDKTDDPIKKTATLKFVSCSYIAKHRTGDQKTTSGLRRMIKSRPIVNDIVAFLRDRDMPADENTLKELAEQILKSPPEQGYLTISNALQWRLNYRKVVKLPDNIPGIDKIVSYDNPQS